MKSDIRAMLDSVTTERTQVERRLATLKQREDTLRAWLAEEQPSQANLQIEGGHNGATPLSSLLRSVLSDGKPHTNPELAKIVSAKGLIEGDKSPGRVVHFALVGLQKHDYVKRDDEGAWVAKKPRAPRFL
jgi:hypothetical protein